MKVSVIINPISGTGGRRDVARDRAARAAACLARHGLDGAAVLTGRPGHARELADAALARGADTVIAWGGDGTVNEVASALAFRQATLGIIPSGSGNGLARELRIPLEPDAAFAVAIGGATRVIDAGELDGRLFFNVAGIGLDARVAHRFAVDGLVRRGFFRYVSVTLQELFAFSADEHTIATDGESRQIRALLVAIANGRQYGNGAIVAPHAVLDDGRLDVVVIAARSPLRAMAQLPFVFLGMIARMPGVTMQQASVIEVTSPGPIIYHLDGEPFAGDASVRARSRPAALRVRVP
jgi:YegS/Rv2252/BmrU family lipid kinase